MIPSLTGTVMPGAVGAFSARDDMRVSSLVRLVVAQRSLQRRKTRPKTNYSSSRAYLEEILGAFKIKGRSTDERNSREPFGSR
jgi:hypothetical protein